MNINKLRNDLKELLNINNLNKTTFKTNNDDMVACVAINLHIESINELKILLIKRTEREDDPWSGHMALPGGGVEKIDQSLYDTVKRENLEEVGFSLPDEGFLGALNSYSPGKKVGGKRIIINPFVFLLKCSPKIIPCEKEVQKSYWVNLSEFFKKQNFSNRNFKIGEKVMSLPSFKTNVDGDEIIVWGVTYVILLEFLYILKDLHDCSHFLSKGSNLNSIVDRWAFFPYK